MAFKTSFFSFSITLEIKSPFTPSVLPSFGLNNSPLRRFFRLVFSVRFRPSNRTCFPLQISAARLSRAGISDQADRLN